MPAFQRKSEEQELPGLRQTTTAWLALCAHPYFSVLFPPAFVESQMPQVDRLRILKRGVPSSSSLCCGSFIVVFTLFSFQSEDLEKFKVFPQNSVRIHMKVFLQENLTQTKLFLNERITPC